MAEARRSIGIEILEGIREIKRGEHGRVTNVPSVAPVITPEAVIPLIRRRRGEQVLLSADVATLHGISVAALHRAVERNAERFPPDFVFRTPRAKSTYAFTEQGIAMLCGVLRSPRGVAANMAMMRGFVQLRRRAFDA